MPLFDRGYKVRAEAELERKVRELEESNKKEMDAKKFDEMIVALNSNLEFAERLNLISDEQEEAYKERIKRAETEFTYEREIEQQNNVETNSERSAMGMTMEETQAMIEQLRAERNAKQQQVEQERSQQSRDDEGERVK